MIGHVQYINAHKGYAETHIDLQHNSEVQIAFTGINGDELNTFISGGVGTPLNDYIMHMLPLRGRMRAQGKYAGARDVVFGGFMILGRCPHDDRDFREQEAVYDNCKEIGLQVVCKMHNDLIGGKSLFDKFDLGQVRYEQIGWVHNSWVGYEFTYPLTEPCPSHYDPEKWL